MGLWRQRGGHSQQMKPGPPGPPGMMPGQHQPGNMQQRPGGLQQPQQMGQPQRVKRSSTSPGEEVGFLLKNVGFESDLLDSTRHYPGTNHLLLNVNARNASQNRLQCHLCRMATPVSQVPVNHSNSNHLISISDIQAQHTLLINNRHHISSNLASHQTLVPLVSRVLGKCQTR